MQDRQLYQQILGISSPWFVERVELREEREEVVVHLRHERDAVWTCAECGRECPIHDHHGPRTWRHLDTCQYRTILSAAVPRTKCPEHGVRLARVPWAEPHGRFTMLFERLVIDWLGASSQTAVAKRMGLTWDEVHGIMDRAVARGLKRRRVENIPRIGVDEKAFCKGHSYATLVTDLDRSRVLYVAKDRKQISLDGFWGTLRKEQLDAIEAVAIDMWDPFEASIRQHLPEAEDKIVYDKFHVAKHLGEAVDRVRRAEHKALRAEGDQRLKGTRYSWLRNPSNFSPKQWLLEDWENRGLFDTKCYDPRMGQLKRSSRRGSPGSERTQEPPHVSHDALPGGSCDTQDAEEERSVQRRHRRDVGRHRGGRPLSFAAGRGRRWARQGPQGRGAAGGDRALDGIGA
jgi:transposase